MMTGLLDREIASRADKDRNLSGLGASQKMFNIEAFFLHQD